MARVAIPGDSNCLLAPSQRRALEDFYAALGSHDLDLLDGVLTANWEDLPPAPGQVPGPDGLKPIFQMLLQAFPDLSLEILEVIAETDRATVRVLVRGTQRGVNPLDLKLLSGVMQSVFAIGLPYVLGTDIAGVVEQTGELVTRFSPGDRVVRRLLPTRGGGFCEKVLAPAHALTLIADDLNYEEAAAIPTAAGTAWLCLFDIGKVRGRPASAHPRGRRWCRRVRDPTR